MNAGFTVGKQIHMGYRCPNCNLHGLVPHHQPIHYMPTPEGLGFVEQGAYNFYRCRNCYAEFEAEMEVKNVDS